MDVDMAFRLSQTGNPLANLDLCLAFFCFFFFSRPPRLHGRFVLHIVRPSLEILLAETLSYDFTIEEAITPTNSG